MVIVYILIGLSFLVNVVLFGLMFLLARAFISISTSVGLMVDSQKNVIEILKLMNQTLDYSSSEQPKSLFTPNFGNDSKPD